MKLSPQQIFDARVLTEQGAFDREQRANRDRRIRRAFDIDPDLPVELMADRFGMTHSAMLTHMQRLGIRWGRAG